MPTNIDNPYDTKHYDIAKQQLGCIDSSKIVPNQIEPNEFDANKFDASISTLKSMQDTNGSFNINTSKKVTHSFGIDQMPSSIAPVTTDHLSIEKRMILNQMRQDELYNREITFLSERIDSLSKQREELGNVEITAMEKQAERVNKESTITSFLKMGAYPIYAASCAIGLTAGLPPIIAGVVLTSGVVGLANRVFSDFNIWETAATYFYPEKNEAKEVAETIDQSLSVSASWLGVIGAAGGATLGGAGIYGLCNSTILKHAGTWGSTLFSAVTQYNLDSIKKEIEEGNSEYLKIQGLINENKKNQQLVLVKNEENTKNNSSLLSKIMNFLKLREEIKRKLTKQ